MGVLVALQYPNGRTHECELEMTLGVGDEFDLFGRRWKASGNARRHSRFQTPHKLLCAQIPAVLAR
jgi:hypothetical protein